MKIEIKNLLLKGYSPEEITEGIIGDTYKKYKKPILAGAFTGLMGVSGLNVYQATFSPEAKQLTNNLNTAVRNTDIMKPYAHLSDKDASAQFEKDYKNDKIKSMGAASSLMGDPNFQKALAEKNNHIEAINSKTYQQLPIGVVGGSLLLSAASALRNRRKPQQ